MFTRKNYLEKKCTHSQYYNQFLNENLENYIADYIGKEAILKSNFENFSDIELTKFEVCHTAGVNQKMRELGDYLTLSGVVCINKQACKNWKNRQLKNGNVRF